MSISSPSSFKIKVQFITGSTADNVNKRIFSADTNNNIMLCDSDFLRVWLGTGGSSWDILEGEKLTTSQLKRNTTYSVIIEFDGSKYKVYLDGMLVLEHNSTTKIAFGSNINLFQIGSVGSDNFFNGSIDLKQFSITVDNKRVLSGANSMVKLISESYTDYDIVINPENETFRLPLKTKLASGSAVVGNGKTLTFTDGKSEAAFYTTSTVGIDLRSSLVNKPIGTMLNGGTYTTVGAGLGVTTDLSKSGIETSSDGLYLYFYVGETVQNVNLIDAGRMAEALALKTDKMQAAVASTPSNKYIDIALQAEDKTYEAPAVGWYTIRGAGTSNNCYIEIVNRTTGDLAQGVYGTINWNYKVNLKVGKGDKIKVNRNNINIDMFRFIYAKGAQ